ncbi:MAG: tetratricopeptide repeat protein [Candidatus Neomarinimicrobiota bacterium]
MDLFYIVIFIIIIIGVLWSFYVYLKPSRKKETDAIYMDALNAMLGADKRKAIALLSSVVKKDSNHINAYLQLGNLLRDETPDKAIKIHQMLTVRKNLQDESRIEILKSLSLDYDKLGDFQKAKIEAEKVLNIDKSNYWASSFLLMIAEKNEDWDYAEKKVKELQKLKEFSGNVDLSLYTLQKGVKYLKNNNMEEAEKLFKKAINDSPNYGLPYKYLGDIKNINRDLVKAVENWEKFMKLSPSEGHKVFDSIETALFDSGRYSEVEKFYRKVLDENPSDINARLRLANVLNEKGENKSAIELIDQLIDQKEASISVMLMKLKLSLSTQTTSELSFFLDEILAKIKDEKK